MDRETNIGPMICTKEETRAEVWVNVAVAAGAVLECGGNRECSLFEPTVLTSVTDEMKVSCEEIFIDY